MRKIQKPKYHRIPADPTARIEREIHKTLKKHEEYVPPELRRKFTPHHSKPPNLHGLPKIQKRGGLLWPINSSRTLPTSELAIFLLPIIQTLERKTATHVKNIKHFAEVVKSVKIAPEDYLLSFDLESLFINVSLDEALDIIGKNLSEDEGLMNKTDLPVDAIMELLEPSLRNCHFQEGQRLFIQEDGLPMLSPQLPIIANIYIKCFGEYVLKKSEPQPKL